MTRIFVMTNHKGGVGKSTTATNVAYGMVRLLHASGNDNSRVLLIDTDSQSHGTLVTTGRKDYGRDNSLYSVVMADTKQAATVMSNSIVQSHWHEDLHVLPASALLEGAERELMAVPGAPYRLADALKLVAPHYAAVLIDTRPSFSLMTEMSLLAATDAIIPVEPRYLETVGLTSVVEKILQVREGWRHPDLRITGIVITKLDRRVRGHADMVDDLRQSDILGRLLAGIIPINEAVAYAHREHQSVIDFAPSSSAAEAYVRLSHHLTSIMLGTRAVQYV